MNQKVVERHDGCVLNDVIFWKEFVLNDDQFCVKLKTVAIKQISERRKGSPASNKRAKSYRSAKADIF